jgi:glycosyltransferase involved in cell wall biosynthesis
MRGENVFDIQDGFNEHTKDVRHEIPYVSVLVPARNETTLIRPCVVSLMMQDYPAHKYEVIVIDDSSSDTTVKVVQELQRQHANLTLTKNKGIGTADARNTGLSCSRRDDCELLSARRRGKRVPHDIVKRLKESDNMIAGVGCMRKSPRKTMSCASTLGESHLRTLDA